MPVFDGLLQHHGTENVSGMKNGVNDAVEKARACVNDENFSNKQKRNRYFIYMAIAVGADPNTYVTGNSRRSSQRKRKFGR